MSDGRISPKPVSVLFVCLGNICRSTMAEGVFHSLTHVAGKPAHALVSHIDSCGTAGHHVGSDPDARTMATLRENGITSYRHSARKFSPSSDLQKFDFVLAMDGENLKDLLELRQREIKRLGGDEGVGKVMLFGHFGGSHSSGRGEEIQDPYYGGASGFAAAYEQSVRFSKAFLEQLEAGELS